MKQIVTDHAARAEFFAPDVAYEDAEQHLPQILTKHGRADDIDGALAYLGQLRAFVLSVPDDVYEGRRAEALLRIESRDPDDWPILAAALVVDCPIWTEDRDFFGVGVPTWTTDRVELYLDARGDGN